MYTHGRTEGSTVASIKTIRSMDMVFTHGQMEGPIQATGAEESSMV